MTFSYRKFRTMGGLCLSLTVSIYLAVSLHFLGLCSDTITVQLLSTPWMHHCTAGMDGHAHTLFLLDILGCNLQLIF